MIWIFIAILIYYVYRITQVLIRLDQSVILPATVEELKSIRKEPQKTVKPPSYSGQKTGIIFYILLLLYITGMLILIWQVQFADSVMLYFLILLPVLRLSDFLNLFAVTEAGVLCGARFASWKSIQSYTFVPIDINHRYYGHSKVVNDKHELRIKTRLGTLSCIITNEDLKAKLEKLLNAKEVYGG